MAEFLGDFVVLLALVGVGSGLWHLDLVKRESRGTPAKLGAWILILAGAGTAICAASYMLRYRAAGDFDHAYPAAMMQMHDMDMMKKMMGGAGPIDGMEGAPTSAPASATEHAAHHPQGTP